MSSAPPYLVCAALPKWRISLVTRFKPSAPGERKWYANWAGRREGVCLEGVAAGKEIGSACERVFLGTTIMGDAAVTYWKHGASPPRAQLGVARSGNRGTRGH